MAWEDVPDKLAAYALETYARDNADVVLLAEFGAASLADVPEHRRDEFEARLDYDLGAVRNLKASRAIRWPT